MNIKQQIEADLKSAQKAKDTDRTTLLRGLLAEMKNKEIEKKGDLKDEEVLSVLKSENKKREDSIEQFKKGERDDLAKKEEEEFEIIKNYLPEEMEEDRIKTEAEIVIKEVDAESPRDTGKVMSVLMPRLKGQADGSIVSRIVTDLLTK